MELSLQRAQAVFDFFTGCEIDSDRMETRGFGDTKPVASNDDKKGKEQNRRVEIVILKIQELSSERRQDEQKQDETSSDGDAPLESAQDNVSLPENEFEGDDTE
jgi:hypothetical protein